MSVVSCDRHNTDTPEVTPAKYTIMLYGCGGGNVDNQLEDALEGAVQALGADNNQVSYTVMYSMSANASKEDFPDTFRGERGKTYRYVLSKDTDLTQSGYRNKYFYKNASEVELYKACTLTDFIKWSMQNAPAENYILEMVNHGGGFDLDTEYLTRGIAYDDNHKVDGASRGHSWWFVRAGDNGLKYNLSCASTSCCPCSKRRAYARSRICGGRSRNALP